MFAFVDALIIININRIFLSLQANQMATRSLNEVVTVERRPAAPTTLCTKMIYILVMCLCSLTSVFNKQLITSL